MPNLTAVDLEENTLFHSLEEGSVVTEQVVAASSTTYLAGTVLQRHSTDGELTVWDTSQTEGAYDNVPVAVLVNTESVTTSAISAQVVYQGSLNTKVLNIGAGTTRTAADQEELDYMRDNMRITVHGGEH